MLLLKPRGVCVCSVLLFVLIGLNGCAWAGMAAAGFVGQVLGTLVADSIEGKHPLSQDSDKDKPTASP